MRASRKNAKPTLLRRVLACLVSAAMVVAFTPVVAWGGTGSPTVELDIKQGSITITSTGYKAAGNSNETSYTGSYTIKSTATGAVKNTITVSSGAHNITLNGVDIEFDSNPEVDRDKCAFEITSGATVTLKLEGENILKSGCGRAGLQVETPENGSAGTLVIAGDSTGSLTATGSGGAGIGGGHRGSGGAITINGGTVTAISADGAGIGGGVCDPSQNDACSGGIITINGGMVTATSTASAGIGGGMLAEGNGSAGAVSIAGGTVKASSQDRMGIGGSGGTVTISGGTVEATGYASSAGIGGGCTFSTSDGGNAVIFASSISDKTNQSSWSGVIFEGAAYSGEGLPVSRDSNDPNSVAITRDLTIENGKSMTVGSNAEVTIAENVTLTNNGTIINKGTITGSGTIAGNQPVIPYVDANGTPQLAQNATEVTESTTSWSSGWYVAKGDVTISQNVNFSGDVHLILADGCTLRVNGSIDGGSADSGSGSSLTIYGQSTDESTMGKLGVTDNLNGGGAMPCSGSTGGSIAINGGSVKATTIKGGYGGSGSEPVLGDPGGTGGNGGNIIINGGTVEAQSIAGGDGGNGGGGGGQNSSQGPSGSVGSVLINGGVVYADSTVNGSVRGTGAVYYPLTLNDATASGSIVTRDSKTYGKAGGAIALNAGDAPTGKKLEWVVSPSTTIIEGNTLTMPSAATTVTAKFNLITYTITYVLGGGDNGGNPDTYTVESDTITLQPGKRSGYTFEGWYDGTGAKVTEIAKGSTDNITLTAKWNAIYTPPATPQASASCIKAIDALPDVDAITLEDGEAIEAARAAYEALTDYQKSFVPAASVTKLEAAEQHYADLVAVAPVESALTELPQADKLKTSQAKAAMKKAQAALEGYTSLTDGQKALVDEALVANAQQVVVKGAILIAKADKKAIGKVKNKAFSVKYGYSKSIYFKTLASAAGTKVTYKKASGSKYITVSKTGKVTAKKGMKEDKTYTAKLKVTCGKSWKYVKVVVKVRG